MVFLPVEPSVNREETEVVMSEASLSSALTNAAVVTAERVTKQYNDGAFTAVSDMSFELHKDEITAFIGPSGCGKTTMLRMLAGLEYPSFGQVKLDNKIITGPGPERGMIFQTYTSFPWLTAAQNVEYGMRLLGISKRERQQKAREFLKLVHLEGFADSYPMSLSGGMKQRVAIARTLAQSPEVLLLDEPFGALDAQVRWEMQEMMIEIITREKKTVVLVTHDIQEAIYLADRIIFYTRNPGQVKADMVLKFKNGRRFPKKEELICQQGYAEAESELFAMMREEIEKE